MSLEAVQKPYATLTPDYEGVIVREFGRFVGQGAVYKGLAMGSAAARASAPRARWTV